MFSAGAGQGSNFFFSLPAYVLEVDPAEGSARIVKKNDGDCPSPPSGTPASAQVTQDQADEIERQKALQLENNLTVFAGLHVLLVRTALLLTSFAPITWMMR